MVNADDIEPVGVDDAVGDDSGPPGVTVRRTERPPSCGEEKPLTGLVGLASRLTGDLSTLEFLDEIRDGS